MVINKEIKELAQELILKFPEKVRNSKDIFKVFITYVYSIIEDKINSTKQVLIRNKYIKIRKSVLQYFIANEKAITSEILKSKSTQ
jgi:hypothetical protein